MIKINLLHAKKGKGKGKAGGQKEIIIFAVAVVCLLGLLGLVQWKLTKEKEETFARIQKTKEDIKYYNTLIAQAQKDKEKQKTLAGDPGRHQFPAEGEVVCIPGDGGNQRPEAGKTPTGIPEERGFDAWGSKGWRSMTRPWPTS